MRIISVEWGKPEMLALPFAIKITHNKRHGFGYVRFTIFKKQVLIGYHFKRWDEELKGRAS